MRFKGGPWDKSYVKKAGGPLHIFRPTEQSSLEVAPKTTIQFKE